MARDKQIVIRVDHSEFDQIKESSDECGMTVAEYVRNASTQGISKVLHDNMIDTELRSIHEDSRSIACDLHEISLKCDGSVASEIGIKWANDKLKELNMKLRYIEDHIKETHGNNEAVTDKIK